MPLAPHGAGRSSPGGWTRTEVGRLGGGPAADPGDEALRVDIRRAPSGTVVTVTGELDAAGEPLLTAVVEYVLRAEGPPVAVDLAGVPVADTHGLAAVLRRGVVVVGASRRVARLLAVLGSPERGRPPLPCRASDRPDAAVS